MINVIFDSTVLRADPHRKKAAMRVLTQLGKAGNVRIFVPSLVREELLSHFSIEADKSLRSARKAIGGLTRSTEEEAVAADVKRFDEMLDALMPKCEEAFRSTFAKWLAEAKGEVIELEPADAIITISDYFAGTPPFKDRKKRDDFPDAFIWKIVLRIVEKHGESMLISDDGGFSSVVAAHGGVRHFRSIEDFLTSKEAESLTPEVVKANFQRLIALLPNRQDILLSAIEQHFVDFVAGEQIHSEAIPGENNDGYVATAGDPEDIELRIAAAEYYGLGMFVVPFSAASECAVEFAIHKSDYYAIPADEVFPARPWNELYFAASREWRLSVEGNVSVQLPANALQSPKLTDTELLTLVQPTNIVINSITGLRIPTVCRE